MRYKPEGYPDLSPYLVVKDAKIALEFLRATFDIEVRRKHLTDAGRIQHCEILMNDAVIMLGESKEPTTAHLHLYLPDPERALARARAAGGTIVQEVQKRADGDVRGGVRAPCGTTYWLARDGAAASA